MTKQATTAANTPEMEMFGLLPALTAPKSSASQHFSYPLEGLSSAALPTWKLAILYGVVRQFPLSLLLQVHAK